MLSLTAVKLKIHKGLRTAVYFAFGVSVIVIAQAYVAVGFSKLLMNNTENILFLRQTGTWLFLGLSIFFFYNATKPKKEVPKKKRFSNGFIKGIFFSSVNMFAVPYYFGLTSTYAVHGYYEFNPSNNISFVLGSFFGTFLLLYIYILLANSILKKLNKVILHIDLILGILTGVIAIINAADLYL